MIQEPQNLETHLASIRARYPKSRELLSRALKRIPIASQTFSKSYLQYPKESAPLFLDRGKGSRVWDVDGNEYVDLVIALMPNILGYCDPDVDQAVMEQLAKGVSFSLATELEIQLAELVATIIPCAEMSRFFKNGSDATSAAIRIARAATGRDHVAVCGYHGWQDWYIGSTTRNRGVPLATQELTHKWTYNDLSSLENLFEEHPGDIAAVILEPTNVVTPDDGFLQGVADLTRQHGAILVFDEIITGFRFHIGGAQTLYGVTPDLASFGKSMANGYPLSMLVGRADIMSEFNDVFLSGTFGGEALSLAAAIATINKMQREPVHQHLMSYGHQLKTTTNKLIQKHDLQDYIGVIGHPTWTLMTFADSPTCTQWDMKTLYLQEILAQGVLTLGSHNISYALTKEDLELVQSAQDYAFSMIRRALSSNDFTHYLAGESLVPLFKVR